MTKIIFFFLFVSFTYASDLLFLLQDAGETQALLPVLEKLEKESKDFTVLAGGVAQDQLQGKSWMHPLPIDKSWKRSEKISDIFLHEIVEKYPAKKVVSGVAFEFHGQLLQAYEKKGAKTFAYWDNINFEGSDPYFTTAQKVAKTAQTVLVPSTSFLKHLPNAVAVGQPSLEKWRNTLSKIDIFSVRKRLPFLKNRPVAVFIGGYGKEYEEAFSLFLNVASSELKEYDIVVSFHPKMGGRFERENLPPSVHLLEPSYGVSTQEAVALADLVLCHQSTVGIQAAASGKRVIYLIPKGQTYINPAIEQGVAQSVSSAVHFAKVVQAPPSSSIDPFDAWEMPKNSACCIYELLTHE